MTISVKHAFESAKSDGVDTTLVQPSNWNAEHTFTAAAGKVIGRDATGAGAIQELALSFATNASNSGATFGGTLATTDSLTVGSPSGAGFIMLPSGTTAQRPSSVEGRLRYNTELHRVEYYNGTSWTASGGGGSSVTISDTPPGSPSDNDLWWSSSDGTLYVRYNDGTSTQWVAVVTGGASAIASQFVRVAATANAQNNVLYGYDVSAGDFTVTLPGTASLVDGHVVGFFSVGSISSNKLTISGNSNNIAYNGLSGAASITVGGVPGLTICMWDATAGYWRAVTVGTSLAPVTVTTGTVTPPGGAMVYEADVSGGAIIFDLTNSPLAITVALKGVSSISNTNYVRMKPPSGKKVYEQTADDTVSRTSAFDKWTLMRNSSGNYC